MKISRLLATAALATYLFSASASADRVVLHGKNRLNRPSKETASLIVNLDTSFRTVTHKSEADGLQDIVKLISESEYEEEWLYLPDMKTWYEIGRNETSVRHGTHIEGSLISDPSGLEDILGKQKTFTFYHFHPIDKEGTYNFVHELWLNQGSRLGEKNREPFYSKMAYLFAVHGGVPSPGDIRKMSRLKIANYKKSKIDVRFKVVSVLGTFEYSLTKKGLEKFKNVNTDPNFNKELEQYSSRIPKLLEPKNFDLLGWLATTDYKPFIEKMASGLSSEYILIKYEPLRK
jgi:hypothetical protein